MGFIAKAAAIQKVYEKGTNFELGQSLNLQNTLNNTPDDVSAATVLRKHYTGVVHTCVGIIAREVAKHEIKLFRVDAKGNKVQVADHDILKLINKPNKGQSEYDMAEATESYREMVGEYFIAFNMALGSNKPLEAYALRPDRFTLVPDSTGNLIAYEYNRPDGKIIKFEPFEVMHDKTFNPNNDYRGIGTIQAAIRNILIEDSASQYTKSFFENNATPAGIVAVKGSQEGYTFGDSAHKKLKQKWLDEYKGSSNAGKIAFLREAEVSYQQIGLGLDKIDMKILREMTEDSIYKAFGIPTIYVGDFGSMNYASAEVAERVFLKNAIVPRLIKRQQMWQRVLERFYPNDKLVFSYENIVPEDHTRKLEIAKNGSIIGLTENEKRELVGYEQIPQGETVWRPMNLVEYTTKGATRKVMFKKAEAIDETAIVKAHKENEHIRKESYRSSHEALQKRYEEIAMSEMKSFLSDQNARVKENLAPKKGLKEIMFNKTEEDKQLENTLTPIVTQLYVETGALVINFLGQQDDFTPLNTDVTDYITQQVKKLAGAFNEQTQDQLLATLTEGFTEGDSVAAIAKRIDKVYQEAGAFGYDGKNGYRAERVARTEIIRSNNHAAQESYRQLGVTRKEWFSNPGACPQCVAMDGRTVGITQNFLQKGEQYLDADGKEHTNSYENVAHAPLHSNCRCTIISVIDR